MPGMQRPENPKHDAAYKNFFIHPRTVADTLRASADDFARHLDFTTLERMPASFVTEHLGQRHTDMLWQIGTIDGGWVYILILLEFQSTVDRRMALRMMDYTATIWMRLGREDLGPNGEYPFVLPVVIYNGERRWTAETDIGDLIGPVPGEPLGYRPPPPVSSHRNSDAGSGLAAAGQRARDDREVRAGSYGGAAGTADRSAVGLARGGRGAGTGRRLLGVDRTSIDAAARSEG